MNLDLFFEDIYSNPLTWNVQKADFLLFLFGVGGGPVLFRCAAKNQRQRKRMLVLGIFKIMAHFKDLRSANPLCGLSWTRGLPS